MKSRMWAKLASWGLPCYFLRCCIFVISCYLFERDCLLFSKEYVTVRCPDMLFSSGLLIFFSVWESLWVFCNARIARLQASKSSRNCSSSMQLGSVFILLICTVEAHCIPECSQQHSYRGVMFSKLFVWISGCILTLQTHLPWFIFPERLSGAKDTHWLGCNRYLPSVIHLSLFSFCSGVTRDIVILCLKQGRDKTSSSDCLDIRKSCGRPHGFKVWVLLSRS